jgi:hypothetical protein
MIILTGGTGHDHNPVVVGPLGNCVRVGVGTNPAKIYIGI